MWRVNITVGSYMNGEYVNLELPCDEEELQERLDYISIDGQHDIYIADIENLDCRHITTYHKLNQFLRELEEIDRDEEMKEVMSKIMLDENYTYDEIIYTINNHEFALIEVDAESPEELATKIEQEYLPQEVQNIPSKDWWFIDWEQVGLHMICDQGYGFWSGMINAIKRCFYYKVYR